MPDGNPSSFGPADLGKGSLHPKINREKKTLETNKTQWNDPYIVIDDITHMSFKLFEHNLRDVSDSLSDSSLGINTHYLDSEMILNMLWTSLNV